MLSERELQAFREECRYKSDAKSLTVNKLLDHINSLPKPPQVFGEISEEELVRVEKVAGDLPAKGEWVSNPHYPPKYIEIVSPQGVVAVHDGSTDFTHEEDGVTANYICLIHNALPKLLATIRTQAALLRDLQEDSAAVREALKWREIATKYWNKMMEVRKIAKHDGTYEAAEVLIEWTEKQKGQPHD